MEARSPVIAPSNGASALPGAMERALLETLAYADVFDYPLTSAQVHRYLIGLPAELADVEAGLAAAVAGSRIEKRAEFYFLPGRGQVVGERVRRARAAKGLWPAAMRYGRRLARLPFVRMVALSGALAMHNAGADADLDYFIVTEPRRLWLTRAMVVLVVRLAGRRGVDLCPNYLLTMQALALAQRDLYTAHELAQMVPIAGGEVYRKMRSVNRWTREFLPNADGPPGGADVVRIPMGALRRSIEWGLRSPLADPLERWEMMRKIRRFRSDPGSAAHGSAEAVFSANCCKGHLASHAAATRRAFARRRQALTEILR